jgi:hypothetical protein
LTAFELLSQADGQKRLYTGDQARTSAMSAKHHRDHKSKDLEIVARNYEPVESQEAHSALDWILQDLKRFPGKGWNLIRVGL